MASLYISEYVRAADPPGANMPVGLEPAVALQKVTYTTAAASAAFNSGTRFVRVIADADVWLLFGASPTATVAHMFLPADTEKYVGVEPGQKVSAYDGSS